MPASVPSHPPRFPFGIRRAGVEDFSALTALWRRSVEATHDFLLPDHLEQIHAQMSALYLPGVPELWLAGQGGCALGFLGCDGPDVAMLFVEPAHFGRGVGSALLRWAGERHGALRLDVNEQNAEALAFYERQGFVVTGRSDRDNEGRPYPLLHLRQPG